MDNATLIIIMWGLVIFVLGYTWFWFWFWRLEKKLENDVMEQGNEIQELKRLVRML